MSTEQKAQDHVTAARSHWVNMLARAESMVVEAAGGTLSSTHVQNIAAHVHQDLLKGDSVSLELRDGKIYQYTWRDWYPAGVARQTIWDTSTNPIKCRLDMVHRTRPSMVGPVDSQGNK